MSGHGESKSRDEKGASGRSAGGIPTSVYLVGIGIYLVVLSIILFRRGGFIGPDTILPFILVVVIIMGQARTFLRDWIPFVLILFGWQMLRGYADQAARGGGFPLHNEDLIRAERFLFNGELPTLWLQERLYIPGEVHWWDIMATGFWAFHFVLALVFAFLLWVRSRELFRRFAYSLLALSVAGFITYVVFPAVPPWLAAERGTIPTTVHHIQFRVVEQLQVGRNASWIMQNGNPNIVAAMPSLHAAYPTLVFFFSLVHWRRFTPLAFLYCLGLYFSIVYVGDHYVIDALAGIAYAGITLAAIEALYRWRARRRAAKPSEAFVQQAAR